ncbi:MAG: GDP-mannose pyrophosphatase NudK [Saprospiraceae bacterium]|nr:GDP-mannose pyrophosphatase NudK [Saprospiraceae bacterium]
MNPTIKIIKKEVLSDNYYTLHNVMYEYTENGSSVETHHREAYDRGNGAVILLYNSAKKKIILTRQFRLPTYINGNATGMLVEACAGQLDQDDPEGCIIRETEEETGYRISKVKRIFDAYMSPGSVTEILYFFVGAYENSMKVSEGGGASNEQENIQVLELDFEEAFQMISTGEIRDAKTIILLQYAKIEKLFE